MSKKPRRTLVMVSSSDNESVSSSNEDVTLLEKKVTLNRIVYINYDDSSDDESDHDISPSGKTATNPTPRSPRETTSLLNKANSCCLSIIAIIIGLTTLALGISTFFKKSDTYLNSKLGSGVVIVAVGAFIAIFGLVLLLIRDRKLNAHVNRNRYQANHDGQTKLNKTTDRSFLSYSYSNDDNSVGFSNNALSSTPR